MLKGTPTIVARRREESGERTVRQLNDVLEKGRGGGGRAESRHGVFAFLCPRGCDDETRQDSCGTRVSSARKPGSRQRDLETRGRRDGLSQTV